MKVACRAHSMLLSIKTCLQSFNVHSYSRGLLKYGQCDLKKTKDEITLLYYISKSSPIKKQVSSVV